jgi:vacuolar-type H+-ATPase subunit I/STV1
LIAGYTLLDGHGVRLAGSAIAYILWSFVLSGLIFFIFALKMQYRQMGEYFRMNWHLGLIGGLGSFFSYGLALWAMTFAPVAVVAALRNLNFICHTDLNLYSKRTHQCSTDYLLMSHFNGCFDFKNCLNEKASP